MKTAERVPMTTRLAPVRAASQLRSRSPSGIPEWTTEIGTGRASRNRATSCGVSPISGTRTRAWPAPARRSRSMAMR